MSEWKPLGELLSVPPPVPVPQPPTPPAAGRLSNSSSAVVSSTVAAACPTSAEQLAHEAGEELGQKRNEQQRSLPSKRAIAVLLVVAVPTVALVWFGALLVQNVQRQDHWWNAPVVENPEPPKQDLWLAANGYYFLTQRVDIATASGMQSLPPGTVVRFLSVFGNSFDVTADGLVTFTVTRDKLTIDSSLLPPSARKDAASGRPHDHEVDFAVYLTGRLDETKGFSLEGPSFKFSAIRNFETLMLQYASLPASG